MRREIDNTFSRIFKKKKRKKFTPRHEIMKMQSTVNKVTLKPAREGSPGGAVVKNPPANAGDTGSSPGLGRSHIPRSN